MLVNGLVTKAVSDEENRPARWRWDAFARFSEQLAASPWVHRLARLGYAAEGLLYVIVGGTASLAAVNVGGRVRGARGALNLIVAQPFGRLVVAFVAVGLCGYILRRFVQVLVEPAEGVPPKPIMRILRRVGFALSGLAHVGIALAALRLVLGLAALSSGGPPAARGWATLLFVWKPLDGWLTLLVGLVIIGVAIFYFYKAVSRRFTMDLELERMSRRVERATLACGVAGYAGRGTGFLIMGAFLVYAGWYVEEVEARGFGDILRALEEQPFGAWILIAAAVGLTAYGVYLLLAARHLRLIAAW
ncbi:MAG TPA: DUF1206 domain-containing protein [Pyrinomonadaceae bacterium]